MKRCLTGLVLALALGATPVAAAETAAGASTTKSKACSTSGYTQGAMRGGRHKCLRVGETCSRMRRWQQIYRQHGFRCGKSHRLRAATAPTKRSLKLTTASLGSSIVDRWQLLIDVGLLTVLCGIHVLAWRSPTADASTGYKEGAQTGLRAAATGGITVAGILIPLTILTITVVAGGHVKLPSTVLADFFVANVWFLIALLLGLYVLYVAGLRGYDTNILTIRSVGAIYGCQLFFLGVGVLRLVWGLSGLVGHLT